MWRKFYGGEIVTLQEAIIKGTAYNDQAAIDRLKQEIADLKIEIKHKERRIESLSNRLMVGKLYETLLEQA